MTVSDGGIERGLNISTSNTVLNGGTSGSTALTLNDSGAHFNSEVDMGGNRITGLAAGIAPTDAVNVGQLEGLRDVVYGGLAISYALDTPIIASGDTSALRIGVGHFKGANALGLTYAARLDNGVTVDLGIGGDTDEEAVGGKLGISFGW